MAAEGVAKPDPGGSALQPLQLGVDTSEKLEGSGRILPVLPQ